MYPWQYRKCNLTIWLMARILLSSRKQVYGFSERGGLLPRRLPWLPINNAVSDCHLCAALLVSPASSLVLELNCKRVFHYCLTKLYISNSFRLSFLFFFTICFFFVFNIKREYNSPRILFRINLVEILLLFDLDSKTIGGIIRGCRWSSGQHVWLLIMRSRVRSPALTQILNVD